MVRAYCNEYSILYFRLMTLLDVKMNKDGSGYYIEAEDGTIIYLNLKFVS